MPEVPQPIQVIRPIGIDCSMTSNAMIEVPGATETVEFRVSRSKLPRSDLYSPDFGFLLFWIPRMSQANPPRAAAEEICSISDWRSEIPAPMPVTPTMPETIASTMRLMVSSIDPPPSTPPIAPGRMLVSEKIRSSIVCPMFKVPVSAWTIASITAPIRAAACSSSSRSSCGRYERICSSTRGVSRIAPMMASTAPATVLNAPSSTFGMKSLNFCSASSGRRSSSCGSTSSALAGLKSGTWNSDRAMSSVMSWP
ncbi:hypothetical protein CASbig_60 [Mycobacterium phage CASbig]|uniref:hypothetical protein n=1 Tax=Mycobacterium phage CASbig TaxID=1327035 RepID=UPI00032B6CE9|nr:hypothetical protein JMN56_gp60 [Mycobacterium phage CASbig]AGK88104.1 hypothetical protein CASbig_60 [Mycobacterium phage CASbig]